MLDAAMKALAQMFTRPFGRILLKSIGLAIVFMIALAIGLEKLFAWLTGDGGQWLEIHFGAFLHGPIVVIGSMLAIVVGIGLFAGAIFLMPAVTALVASFFSDEIAELVERSHYPLDPSGNAVALPRAVWEGLRCAVLAIIVYVCAFPFLLFAGLGALMFYLATAYLLGREYFELAAMRFHPAAEAKALRRRHRGTVFAAGCFIAGFVSIPIVNLATPLFGMAMMVHMYKKLAGGGRRELLEPSRVASSPAR